MTKTRVYTFILLGLAAAVAVGCASHTREAGDGVRREIARQYGIDGFDQIEALRFTFNAQVGDKQVRRSWQWTPVSGEVAFRAASPSTAARFSHPLPAGSTDTDLRDLDAKFVNDRYWLLFPLHLVWDQAAEVEDHGRTRRPIGGGEARRIEVRYPPAGGYTPGDVYELFVGSDGRIVEWVYRRGGDPRPTRMSTWEVHRRLGPLVVSLDHRGPDGFRVWFSDVAVRLKGQTDWIQTSD
jgi:hypothetical protein